MTDKQPLAVNTPIRPIATQVSGPLVAPPVNIPPPYAVPQGIVLYTAPQAQGNVSADWNRQFNVKAGRITGITQIVCALLSATFGILAIVLQSENYWDFFALVAWPIWGAVLFYLVAGIIGLSTGSKNTCVIVAYMVMSIFAALSGAGQVIFESIGASAANWDYNHGREPASLAMHSLAAVVAFIEMIVAIVAAAYCCHGVCCRTKPQQVIVQYATTSSPQLQTVPPPSAPPQYYEPVH